VAHELEIAEEQGIPYSLLLGYSEKSCYKPASAGATYIIYKRTWDNLKALIEGHL
jgi:hypothetical protein